MAHSVRTSHAPKGQARAGDADNSHATVGYTPVGHGQAGYAQVGCAPVGHAQTGQADAGRAHAGQADAGRAHAGQAMIGPNAVIQLVAALKAAGLDELAAQLFADAGVPSWLDDPPSVMIDEHPVARLHQGLRAALPPTEATTLMQASGRLTADYLLANRIPPIAQVILKLLPPRLAAVLLVPAIQAHAWTFAGSGEFAGRAGSPTVFALTRNPLCLGERAATPVCAWHAAVFQRLFEVLVSPAARVQETACEACGDGCCRFVVDWRGVSSFHRSSSPFLRPAPPGGRTA